MNLSVSGQGSNVPMLWQRPLRGWGRVGQQPWRCRSERATILFNVQPANSAALLCRKRCKPQQGSSRESPAPPPKRRNVTRGISVGRLFTPRLETTSSMHCVCTSTLPSGSYMRSFQMRLGQLLLQSGVRKGDLVATTPAHWAVSELGGPCSSRTASGNATPRPVLSPRLDWEMQFDGDNGEGGHDLTWEMCHAFCARLIVLQRSPVLMRSGMHPVCSDV